VLLHASPALAVAAECAAAVSDDYRADLEALLSELQRVAPPPDCKQCAVFTLTFGRATSSCECASPQFYGLHAEVLRYRKHTAEHAAASLARLDAIGLSSSSTIRDAVEALGRFGSIARGLAENQRKEQTTWAGALGGAGGRWERLDRFDLRGEYTSSPFNFIRALLDRLVGTGPPDGAQEATAAVRAGLLSFRPEAWAPPWRHGGAWQRVSMHGPVRRLLERAEATAGLAGVAGLSHAHLEAGAMVVWYDVSGAVPLEEWRRRADLVARLRVARKLATALVGLAAVGIAGPMSANCMMILGEGGEAEPAILDRGAFTFDGRRAAEYGSTAWELVVSLLAARGGERHSGRMGAVAEAASAPALQARMALGGIVPALDRVLQSEQCTVCLGTVTAPRLGAACDNQHYACGECLDAYVGQQDARITQTEHGMQVQCMCCPLPLPPARLVPCLSPIGCHRWQRRIGDAQAPPPGARAGAGAGAGAADSDENALAESLHLRCPSCDAVFFDFDGCLSLNCKSCNAIFCGACLAYVAPGDEGEGEGEGAANAHAHASKCRMNPARPVFYLHATVWEAIAVGHRARQGQAAWDALAASAQAHLHESAAARGVRAVVDQWDAIGGVGAVRDQVMARRLANGTDDDMDEGGDSESE